MNIKTKNIVFFSGVTATIIGILLSAIIRDTRTFQIYGLLICVIGVLIIKISENIDNKKEIKL